VIQLGLRHFSPRKETEDRPDATFTGIFLSFIFLSVLKRLAKAQTGK
jgi:hypothetical protein